MNRQQLDQQLDYLRRTLTQINLEMLYLEGSQLQARQMRQTRLVAELERLEFQRYFGQVLPAAPMMPTLVETSQMVK